MRVSAYTKSGVRAATTYYRIWQYLSKLSCESKLNKMLSDGMYERVMPISEKGIAVKGFVFFYVYIRVLGQLIRDFVTKPDIIILSRRFINRCLPRSYQMMLNSLKRRGTRFIWDFDDEIIVKKEVTEKGFAYLSEISDHILVASPVNERMVAPGHRGKVMILPTTDGDMYHRFNSEVEASRLAALERGEIRIIWVGTSVSLPFVENICKWIDRFAKSDGREVTMTVVSNRPLEYSPEHFRLVNIPWRREEATAEMLKAHLGIMPLDDSKESEGKGGFKLIQYLSVGLPVIGSAVGINSEIITEDVGFKPNVAEPEEWQQALMKIFSDKENWERLSRNAFRRWKENYGFESNLSKWRQLLD